MKRKINQLGIVLVCLLSFSCTQKKENKKPNVVFILVDDLGWKDLGCYGSEIYETPAIDKLAKEGVQFTNAYAAHPMCVGSRVAIMSGKYPTRLGVPGGKHKKGHSVLPLSEVTIAEALKKENYKTFFAGKWHIGKKDAYPENQGFDINLGGHSKGEPATYFYPYKKEGSSTNVPNLENGDKDEYLTDRLTSESIKFIKKNKDNPFFVYLSHYAVHTPLEAKDSLFNYYKNKIDKHTFKDSAWVKENKADNKMHQNNPTYAGMVASIDQSVKKIRKALEDNNLSENTIIIVTSDNGGDSTKRDKKGYSTSNIPLRGGKCWMYEGGIRVPLIVYWPQSKSKIKKSKHIVTGTDHYPTILEMLDIPLLPKNHLDGRSYAKAIKQKIPQREAVYWHFPNLTLYDWVVGSENCSAIRDNNYKLIEYLDSHQLELYNLDNDISEVHNLKDSLPLITNKLYNKLIKWRKAVNAPAPKKNNNN